MTKPKVKCLRCGYEWRPRLNPPHECPKCLSPKWNVPGRGENRNEVDRVCGSCGQKLVRVKWNSAVDGICCDNPKCPGRSMVISFIKLEPVEVKIGKESSEEGDKSSALQRLRDRILSERQETEIP